jgi:hypothetical protein
MCLRRQRVFVRYQKCDRCIVLLIVGPVRAVKGRFLYGIAFGYSLVDKGVSNTAPNPPSVSDAVSRPEQQPMCP